MVRSVVVLPTELGPNRTKKRPSVHVEATACRAPEPGHRTCSTSASLEARDVAFTATSFGLGSHASLRTFPFCRVRGRTAARRRSRGRSRAPRGRSGAAGLPLPSPCEEIGDLMDEGVLVADLQARHPPVLHVGMIAVGDVERAPAAQPALVAVIEILQPVQIVQIPGDRGVLAVDLERVERLVAAGVAGRLEGGERAVGEAGEKRAASSMPTFSTLPVRVCWRSLMKVSVMPQTSSMAPLSHIAVSMQWASRSPVTPLPATLTSRRQSACAALRQVLGDRPVLQELGAVVKDACRACPRR